MSKRGAALLAMVGAVGLLTIGSLVVAATVQGPLRLGEHLTLANCAPLNPRGTVVHVTLSDRGGAMMGGRSPMMVRIVASPDIVSNGTLTFVATNTGALDHEFLVLPAPFDGVGTRSVNSDGTIDESSSLGEASRSCGRGVGSGISPGASSWVTLQLAPGTYELLCDLPWHYSNGMFTPFTVE